MLRALDLARSRGGTATYAEAITVLFGIAPSSGTGRRVRFRHSDRPEIRSARASLSRSLRRLEALGLVRRVGRAYELVTPQDAAEESR